MARHPPLSAGQLVQRELQTDTLALLPWVKRQVFCVGDRLKMDKHRRSTYCCCGTPPLLDWCWTHVRVGLYWFVLYAFRRRLRAWPGEGVGGRAAGRRVCFLRLSPPASGLARRRRAAQLDGDISFHSSRRRLRDWPGGGAEGRAAGRGILLCASRHRLRAWPGWGGGGARRWTRSLLFYASCRQLRAWPGWGGGGVCCLGAELAFLFFTHWPLDGRPSYARSLVPTPSKTVDQTLPP